MIYENGCEVCGMTPCACGMDWLGESSGTQEPTKSVQRRIYKAVEARGYRDGWNADQFLARNICKATEELYEAAYSLWSTISHTDKWMILLERAAVSARHEFDNGDFGNFVTFDPGETVTELADVYVTLMCAAEALSEITGEDIDLAQIALEKATEDIDRGVR